MHTSAEICLFFVRKGYWYSHFSSSTALHQHTEKLGGKADKETNEDLYQESSIENSSIFKNKTKL